MPYHRYAYANARFQAPPNIGSLYPNLHGSAAGIECRTHQSTPALNRFRFSWHRDRRRIPRFQVRRIYLRNVSASHNLCQVHHRDERSPSSRSFSGIIGPVSDHAIDGAGNFGVAQLSFRARQVTLRGVPLRFSYFQVKLFLRKLIRIFGLCQRDVGIFYVPRGDGAFLKEFLAAIVKLLRRFQSLLREFGVLRDFLDFHVVGCLSLLVSALALLESAGQILILKLSEQLPGFHSTPAIHVELFYGGDDFWNDRCLVARIENRVSNHLELNRLILSGADLHRDGRRFLCVYLGFAAG